MCGRHDEVRGHQGPAAEVASSPLQGRHEGPGVGPGLLAAHDLRGQRGAWGHRGSGTASAAGGPTPPARPPLSPHRSGPFTCLSPDEETEAQSVARLHPALRPHGAPNDLWAQTLDSWLLTTLTSGSSSRSESPHPSRHRPHLDDKGAQWGGGNGHPGTDGQTRGPTHRPAARPAGCEPGPGWKVRRVGPWPEGLVSAPRPPGPLMAWPGGWLRCPTSSPPPGPGAGR